jgi:8-oxo-dGTP pyrophosphatase MutT (NUDIX family)
MRKAISCGIIPIRRKNNEYEFLLVEGYGGFWGFPKGKKEGNETHRETAIRELKEETNLVAANILGNIFTETFRIVKKNRRDIIKKVVYYIGFMHYSDVKLQKKELRSYGWFSLGNAKKKLIQDRQDILDQVRKVLDGD